MLSKRAAVDVESDDLDLVIIKAASEDAPKSVFVRFVDKEKRTEVWQSRSFAKKNLLFMEEFLTGTRQKIFLKCKELKTKGLIKDVTTKNGDVFATIEKKELEEAAAAASPPDKILVVTDTQFENLLKMTKRVELAAESHAMEAAAAAAAEEEESAKPEPPEEVVEAEVEG